MKKIIALVIVLVLAAAGYFGYGYMLDKNVTDSSRWTEFQNSEFKVTLPKNMKSSDKLYHTSSGQEQIAFYQSKKACFSVAKIPYSANESLKKLDIEQYLSNMTINGKELDLIPVNDGFYYSRTKEASDVFKNTKEVFVIEGMFKGKNAVYSVAIQCRADDRGKYEDSMLKWLESFTLKD